MNIFNFIVFIIGFSIDNYYSFYLNTHYIVDYNKGLIGSLIFSYLLRKNIHNNSTNVLFVITILKNLLYSYISKMYLKDNYVFQNILFAIIILIGFHLSYDTTFALNYNKDYDKIYYNLDSDINKSSITSSIIIDYLLIVISTPGIFDMLKNIDIYIINNSSYTNNAVNILRSLISNSYFYYVINNMFECIILLQKYIISTILLFIFNESVVFIGIIYYSIIFKFNTKRKEIRDRILIMIKCLLYYILVLLLFIYMTNYKKYILKYMSNSKIINNFLKYKNYDEEKLLDKLWVFFLIISYFVKSRILNF